MKELKEPKLLIDLILNTFTNKEIKIINQTDKETAFTRKHLESYPLDPRIQEIITRAENELYKVFQDDIKQDKI